MIARTVNVPLRTTTLHNPRFWVYAHEPDGELIESVAYTEDLEDAIAEATDRLPTLAATDSIRVTDNGTTVWMAGPVGGRRE